MRIPIECDDCENRTATCHATCQIHRQAWEERQKKNREKLKDMPANNYTITAISKSKAGLGCSWNKYRPKERKL